MKKTEINCHNCDKHNHEEEKELNKLDILFYVIGIIIFILSFISQFKQYETILYVLVVLFSGYKLIFKGIINLFKFNFEEDTLMTIAMIAAFALKEYPEGCMIILLYRLGEFLQDIAVDNSNKSIKEIVEIKAKTANVISDLSEKVVDVEDVKVGEKILIKPGEMVPLDCRIVKGSSSLDTSSVTGESIPVNVEEGVNILSGSINLSRCNRGNS